MLNLILTLFVLGILGVALAGILYTRRLLTRFSAHLQGTREELDERLRQRRNLIPSFIALSAGIHNLELEHLETLDNAAELVLRSKGFAERAVAENRLASALGCLRRIWADPALTLPPGLTHLITALDDREAGIAMAAELYNRQVQTFNTSFGRLPCRWLGPLCGYQPAYPVDIRLSSTPAAVRSRRPQP